MPFSTHRTLCFRRVLTISKWPNQSQTRLKDSVMPSNSVGEFLMRYTRRLRDNLKYRETPFVDASMADVQQKASLPRTRTFQRPKKRSLLDSFDCLSKVRISLYLKARHSCLKFCLQRFLKQARHTATYSRHQLDYTLPLSPQLLYTIPLLQRYRAPHATPGVRSSLAQTAFGTCAWQDL